MKRNEDLRREWKTPWETWTSGPGSKHKDGEELRDDDGPDWWGTQCFYVYACTFDMYINKLSLLILTCCDYRVAQKLAQFLVRLNFIEYSRFSKLFYCQNEQKICNNTITKDPTTPQVCRYSLRALTCEMSSVCRSVSLIAPSVISFSHLLYIK